MNIINVYVEAWNFFWEYVDTHTHKDFYIHGTCICIENQCEHNY